MNRRFFNIYISLVIIIIFLVFLNLKSGSADVSAAELLRIIFGKEDTGILSTVIWSIRIPRIIKALVLGGALSLSGYLLQTFFSNPIAGPYVFGISSGAKLFITLITVFSYSTGTGMTSRLVIGAAFLGALASTSAVIFVSSRLKNISLLIVCGVMIGYICSAITELIISFADDADIVNLHNWSRGSFSSTSWDDVSTFIPVIITGTVLSVFLSKAMGAYLYGESYALSVGINVKIFRVLIILCSSLLSATVTAFAGPVSFVGIAVPHIIKNLFRTSKPLIIIAGSFLGGGLFCLLCDLIARSLFYPAELGISTVTAVFGAPVVISMLVNKKRNGHV